MNADTRPTVAFELAVPAGWRALADNALRDAARQAGQAGLDGALADCGIGARSALDIVTVSGHSGSGGPAGAPVLRVGDARWHCAEHWLAGAHASVARQPLSAAHFGTPDWLVQAGAADTRAPEFVGVVCGMMARRNPQALLVPPVVAAIAETMAHRGVAIRSEQLPQLLAVLRGMLGMRLRVDEPDTLAACWTGADADDDADALAESVFDSLPALTVEIGLSRRTLQAWAEAAEVDAQAAQELRDDMYFDLGLRTPEWSLQPDDTLPDGAFELRVGSFRSPRWQGLADDERLVPDAGGPGDGVLHPLTLTPMRRVRAEAGQATGRVGALGYALAHLSAQLRELAPCFLRSRDVRAMLANSVAVDATLARVFHLRHDAPTLARVLRRLLDEQVSIRNLSRIVEALCEFDCIVADGTGMIVFDDRLPVRERPEPGRAIDPEWLTSGVRGALKRQITAAVLAGRSALPCHLLDAKTERRIVDAFLDPARRSADASPLPPPQRQALLDALYGDIGALLRDRAPVLLTSADARPAVRALLRHAWPQLRVLSYTELRPDITVTPLSRSGLKD